MVVEEITTVVTTNILVTVIEVEVAVIVAIGEILIIVGILAQLFIKKRTIIGENLKNVELIQNKNLPETMVEGRFTEVMEVDTVVETGTVEIAMIGVYHCLAMKTWKDHSLVLDILVLTLINMRISQLRQLVAIVLKILNHFPISR